MKIVTKSELLWQRRSSTSWRKRTWWNSV